MAEYFYTVPEPAIKTWLLTTSVAPLVTVAGKVNIYMAMPKSAPKPVILIALVGGGPTLRADLPVSRYRIQFDVIGDTRAQAATITGQLLGELGTLGATGFTDGAIVLGAADTLGVRWLPDPDSDVPRYIVDALIATVL